MLSPQTQLYNEQKLEVFLDSDTSDMMQSGFYNPYDTSELNDIVFDDKPCFNEDEDQSMLFENELYKSVELGDNQYQHFGSESDPKKI